MGTTSDELDEIKARKAFLKAMLNTGKSDFLKSEHIQNLTKYFKEIDDYYDEKHTIVCKTSMSTIKEVVDFINLAKLAPNDKNSLLELLLIELRKGLISKKA